MCKRRKEKRAQWEEERVQIINIELQQMEERELHPTMDKREREDNSSKRECNE